MTPLHHRITPRAAKIQLNLKHELPCLLNEFYSVVLDICNEEENDITSVK